MGGWRAGYVAFDLLLLYCSYRFCAFSAASARIHRSVKFPPSTSLWEEACVSGFGPSLLSVGTGLAVQTLTAPALFGSLRFGFYYPSVSSKTRLVTLLMTFPDRASWAQCVHLRTHNSRNKHIDTPLVEQGWCLNNGFISWNQSYEFLEPPFLTFLLTCCEGGTNHSTID